MPFTRPAPVIVGGAAVVRGVRYDLARTLYSYETIVDRLTGTIGQGRSFVGSRLPSFKGAVLWNGDGKDKAIAAWKNLAANFEVAAEGFSHVIGPIMARAYLLGKPWLVWNARERTLRTHDGKPGEALDGGPTIEICMREINGVAVGMHPRTSAEIRRLLVPEIDRLKISYLEASQQADPKSRVMATIRFLPDAYAKGEDWIRVRCAQPDGSEVPPAASN